MKHDTFKRDAKGTLHPHVDGHHGRMSAGHHHTNEGVHFHTNDFNHQETTFEAQHGLDHNPEADWDGYRKNAIGRDKHPRYNDNTHEV